MNLLDFPDEVLLQIFRSVSDIDLINVVQVCTRFERISRETVAEKYNGDSTEKYYEMYLYNDDFNFQPLCCSFLDRFSNKITALNIIVDVAVRRAPITANILNYCRSAKYVNVRSMNSQFPVTTMMQSMPNLTSLKVFLTHCSDSNWDQRFPQLESLDMQHVCGIDVEIFKCFLYLNPQLKHLSMNSHKFSLETLQSLKNHLIGLKSLEYDGLTEIVQEWSDIKMDNLESLKLRMNVSCTATVLGAFGRGSKMIRNLKILYCGGNEHEVLSAFKDVIGLFDNLKSLKLALSEVRMDLIGLLVRHLQNLITLHLSDVELEEISADNVLYVFKRCKHLKELTLESETHFINSENQFNLEFQRKLANFARDRGSKIKLEIIQPGKDILLTEEKIIENGELQYWIGYDPSLSRSNIHLFDLGDRVLEKINGYLDDQAQRALYQTCTTMKNALQERIKSQWFIVSDEKTTKDLLNRFGEHITKLDVDMKTNDHKQMAEMWRLIGEKCSDRLTEMQINNVRVDATGETVVQFPKLSKLKVKSMVSSNANIFPLMECPKLIQLEFDEGDITIPDQTTQFGISMKSLTTIRATYFDDNTYKLLNLLDQNCCHQIQELTVVQSYEHGVHIVDNAMRFRNLVTLNLAHTSLQCTRMEHLFQRCSKLRKLTLEIHRDYHNFEFWQRMVRCIKENCRYLEVIQLMASNFQYDHAYSREITKLLPTVELKIVVRDGNRFILDTSKQPKLDHQKPY